MQYKNLRYAALGLLTAGLLFLAGCGPEADTTDPLSDYSVDVIVPAASNAQQLNATSTPAGGGSLGSGVKVTGWLSDTINATDLYQYTMLSEGSLGTAVKNLQKRLIELGYMTGTASSSFDPATIQGVKRFQAAYGQAQTGTADQYMQYYLFKENAKIFTGSYATPTPVNYTGNYTQLERGATGTAVIRLQNRLITLGYLSGSASGTFDANTENAVKEFEAAYGKQRTGIATVDMQKYLFSNNAIRAGVTPSPTPYRPITNPTAQTPAYTPLQYGSRGGEVEMLQLRLKQLGYYSGEIDGIYGNGTVNAVKLFEQAYNHAKTGMATSEMQEYLYADDARVYGAANTPAPAKTPAANYTTLSKGDYSEDVYNLQKRLIELGYLKSGADGRYGDDTVSAVKAFEAAYNREQTGIATIAFQTELYSNNAKRKSDTSNASEYSRLKKGDKGDAVKRLQQRLVELNYLSGTVDGYYGEGTEDAIRAFEKAYAQPQTGIATAGLQTVLFSNTAISNPYANVAVSYSTLEKGDSGTAVKQLQNRLIELGYMNGSADGKFQSTTEDAVKRFQQALGLSKTGVASAALQKQLYASNAPKYGTSASGTLININKPAYVVVDKLVVYKTASEYDEKLGTLKRNAPVTLLRSRGDWAEIKNSSGDIGYAMLSGLKLADELPGGGDDDADITDGDGGAQTGYKQLSTGMSGEAVKRMQSRLKTLGYFSGTLGGNYKTLTTAAVKEFQAAIGYKQTGVATVALQEIMFSSAAPDMNEYSLVDARDYPALSFGDQGEAVADLQTQLSFLGFLSMNDAMYAHYDIITLNAVVDAMLAMGIEGADGTAPPEFQAFLNSNASRAIAR